MIFEGRVWRHLPTTGHPLDTGFILRASGRWNRPGLYGCLYTTLTIEAAIAEFRKLAATFGTTPEVLARRDLVSIDVHLDPVLDLRSAPRRRSVEIALKSLKGDDPADLEACRRAADWARLEGYVAVLAPSAPDPSGSVRDYYPLDRVPEFWEWLGSRPTLPLLDQPWLRNACRTFLHTLCISI